MILYLIFLYLEPSLSVWAITAIIVILAAFLFTFIAIVWHPLKKKFKALRKKLVKNPD